MTNKDLKLLMVDYEIASSWIAPFIWFGWGQDLMARYYANKVSRKFKNYQKMQARKKAIDLYKAIYDEQ